MSITDIIAKIRDEPECEILPISGSLSTPLDEAQWPNDLIEFYSLCGGVVLFKNSTYPFRFLPPSEVVQAGSDRIGECICGDKVISVSWYLLVEDFNGSYISIDADFTRLGRCYDCFIGEPYPVIAKSFSELLERIFENRGEYPYWLRPEFRASDPCDL